MGVFEEEAKIFKALCDEKRIEIIDFIKNKEKCGCQLIELTNLAQSKLAYHIKILIDSGFVTARQQGKWSYYSLNKETADKAINIIKKYLK